MSRKLASIQKITKLSAIPGADRIELARVQGWDVVVQKDLYKVDDLVCYFEIDSILPDKPWCEFMRDRKFKVKTIKLRKQISQGLCVPTIEIPVLNGGQPLAEGADVTEALGVTKYDPESTRGLNVSQRQPVPHSWMLRWEATRKIHHWIWPRKKGSWPQWFPKTDEERVQNLPNINELTEGRVLYASEKLDGQSFTAFFEKDQRVGILSRGLFGICSRNIWFKTTSISNNWCNIANELGIEESLTNYCRANNVSIAIQGEIVGPAIQQNRYKRDEHHLFIFSVFNIDTQEYFSLDEKLDIIKVLGLQSVPMVTFDNDKAKTYLDMAEGESELYPTEREGIVIRNSEDDSFSFKAISNKFLLGE